MRVGPLGGEDPLEEEMAAHSSALAWRIPGTEEPGELHAHKEWDVTEPPSHLPSPTSSPAFQVSQSAGAVSPCYTRLPTGCLCTPGGDYMSMLLPQFTPPAASLTVSTSLSSMSASAARWRSHTLPCAGQGEGKESRSGSCQGNLSRRARGKRAGSRSWEAAVGEAHAGWAGHGRGAGRQRLQWPDHTGEGTVAGGWWGFNISMASEAKCTASLF